MNRATARASELDDEELVRGAGRLREKVREYGPGRVAMLGITAYRTAFGRQDAEVGRQPQDLEGRPLWVLPSPSGLNAHYRLEDFVRLFEKLKD